MNKERIYWYLQIGGWLLYAGIQIVFSFFASEFLTPRRIAFFLVEALLCLLITHSFRLFVKRMKWIKLSLAKLLPRVIIAVVIMGVIIYFTRIPVNLVLGRLFDPLTAFNASNILGQSFFYWIVFFLWTVFYFSYHYFAQYNASLKYEASMVQIELNNLKSQLNPHFIFNALNSIRALVDENPVKSKQAINQLSNIIRNILASDKTGLIKFGDELRVVKDYLGLESIRFEERLKTEFEIDPGSFKFQVPPLMIQTLVENGIKHGISRLTQGGIVQVKTIVKDNTLKVQIRNSGQLLNGMKRSSSGLGLKNTIQRLKLIYGDEASFRIVNESDNFVLTELTIPEHNTHESINRG